MKKFLKLLIIPTIAITNLTSCGWFESSITDSISSSIVESTSSQETSKDEVVEPDFSFDIISKNEVILSKYNTEGFINDVYIPDRVEIDNRLYNVVGVGEGAFYRARIRSVYIGENITFIEQKSFEDCNCENVVFSKKLESIGDEAFYFSNLKGSLNLPEGLKTIGKDAFSWCHNLTNVFIPSSVESIGEVITVGPQGEESQWTTGVFSGCSNLNSIVVSKDNKIYDSRENCNSIIETKTNTMIDGSNHTFIPNDVEIIEHGVFNSKENLHRLNIPASVTIFRDSLMACNNLEFIKVDKDNKTYDSRYDCNSIIETATDTLIGASLNSRLINIKRIDSYAFSFRTKIESIYVPEYIEYVGSNAFCYWTSDQTIEISRNNKFVSQWDSKWNEDCEAKIIYVD